MTELDDIFSSLTRPEKRKHTNDEAPVKSTQGTRGRKREKKAKGAGEAGGALPAKAGGESKADTPAPPRASALAKKDSTSAKKMHEKPLPEVVHDTSATPKPAARAPQPPLDDDDAAFADSRGTERTCAMYTDAGKRTEEGYRVFNEDELKLGQGGGTCSIAPLTQTRHCAPLTVNAVRCMLYQDSCRFLDTIAFWCVLVVAVPAFCTSTHHGRRSCRCILAGPGACARHASAGAAQGDW